MAKEQVITFNSSVEVGLRTLVLLDEAFPIAFSLSRLVVFDYLLVHSDDVEGGPDGLHPQTPHRSGELLVRRQFIQQGIRLYESRQLLIRSFEDTGITFQATDASTVFLDSLSSPYSLKLRDRGEWVIKEFGQVSDEDLSAFARVNLGRWGAEFESESVLWQEEWNV